MQSRGNVRASKRMGQGAAKGGAAGMKGGMGRTRRDRAFGSVRAVSACHVPAAAGCSIND